MTRLLFIAVLGLVGCGEEQPMEFCALLEVETITCPGMPIFTSSSLATCVDRAECAAPLFNRTGSETRSNGCRVKVHYEPSALNKGGRPHAGTCSQFRECFPSDLACSRLLP